MYTNIRQFIPIYRDCRIEVYNYLVVMNIKQVVGDNIRFIRQKRNLTLDDISVMTKMSRTYINDVELAKYAISVVKIEKIAKALKIEPSLLLIKDAYKNIL